MPELTPDALAMILRHVRSGFTLRVYADKLEAHISALESRAVAAEGELAGLRNKYGATVEIAARYGAELDAMKRERDAALDIGERTADVAEGWKRQADELLAERDAALESVRGLRMRLAEVEGEMERLKDGLRIAANALNHRISLQRANELIEPMLAVPKQIRPVVEIIGPDGQVHYRRPEGHPDIDEVKRTPGYSVRLASPGRTSGGGTSDDAT